MTADEIRTHLRYSGWASRKTLEAVLALPHEEQVKAREVSHDSILKTLFHIYMADRIWYKRAVDPNIDMPAWNMNLPPEGFINQWQDIQQRWESWADTLTDRDAERLAVYTMMNGSPGESPLKHIVLHVVNHATLHRGQVVAMLRQAGVKPPATDLLYYLRELQQAAKA